jgi:ATP-dependent DNA helicase RecG
MATKLPGIDPVTFLPIRYDDMRTTTPSSLFEEGGKVLAAGRLKSMDLSSGRRGEILTATMEDEGGYFHVKFLFVTRFHRTVFSMLGLRVYLWGTPKKDDSGWLFIHPELPKEVGRIFPVYRSLRGISMPRLRSHVWDLTQRLVCSIGEELPQEVIDRYGLPSIAEALTRVHNPTDQLPGAAELERVAIAAGKRRKSPCTAAGEYCSAR